MIKEEDRVSKYNTKKTTAEVIMEYVRTVLFSILFAVVITSFLAIHARNQIIKTPYSDNKELLVTKSIAQQILSNTDIEEEIETKSGKTCLYIGDLYATVGEYTRAIYAYNLAIKKLKTGLYSPYYKLLCIYVEMENFDKADAILDAIKDINDKNLIKFKTRSYLTIGDKYYSIGKFLSAAKNYENANFYYSKFSKRDKKIEDSINKRIINAYLQVGDLMVHSGMNSDALRFLKRAEKYAPKDLDIKYKIGIVLADLDPEESIKYLDPLVEKIPQNIDYGVYNTALMKAANIADLDNRPTKAKYYRYKIHSLDMLADRKVVYKNDVDIKMTALDIKKVFFTYPIRTNVKIFNISNKNIINLYGDFVLLNDKKVLETISLRLANKDNPFISNSPEPIEQNIRFRRKIFTKKELGNYYIEIYLYKDKKFKTLVFKTKVIPEIK